MINENNSKTKSNLEYKFNIPSYLNECSLFLDKCLLKFFTSTYEINHISIVLGKKLSRQAEEN
ncbi:hypothetical protein BpHYR1_002718 [Brachionus plicatilis]|uniref:Uncharacterized protein n=1 Tax=Brachionus plicatilis TaxID=10195 RepID=A0A3M7QH34_BRAPC|nr:hypothetical protein BpHYR1_002718 [Brachionus plicatilis]